MKKMKRIGMRIFVTGTRGIPGIQGGIETHCEKLYPRIAHMGCSVTIARRLPYIQDNLNEYGNVQLKDLPTPRSKHFEAIIHTIVSTFYAKLKGFRCIHIHGIGPSLCAPLARLLGLRVVITHHGSDYKRQKWGKLSRFILRLGELAGVTFAHKVIVVSSYIKKRLESMYRRFDINYIPNGVKIHKKVDKNDFLQRWGIDENSYILAVGRLVPEKGFHDLIASYSEIKEKKLKLVLAGDADHETEYSRRLIQSAQESGCILTGFVQQEDLGQLYSYARLFILPSYHEGLPLSLLEALSYGIDVLVSNIPAHTEIGLDSSSYFQCGNRQNLSAKIKEKLAHPYTGGMRNTLLAEYDWEIIAHKTFKLYQELCHFSF
ncbi:MAG: glycosyltransferase family 4 protein [Spirochaetales bacterium]|nr:glycosyltransferase family 4 protein [Spirochaetales bacterium]